MATKNSINTGQMGLQFVPLAIATGDAGMEDAIYEDRFSNFACGDVHIRGIRYLRGNGRG